MNLYELSPASGSNPKVCRRGRGHGSSNGKAVDHGQKDQWTRSGGGICVGFEGGRTPLIRRILKRGSHNVSVKPLEVVNVSVLKKFEDGATVNVCDLLEKGILSEYGYGYKVLGSDTLTKKLTARASVFPASTREKIVAAGGKYRVA